MSEQRVDLSSGLPSTVLPAVADALTTRVVAARAAADARSEVATVVAAHPREPLVWAELGDVGRDVVERYAAYRVGYHRGLDALRANGWRGSGYVRWEAPSNRGFLRCLAGLARCAAAIGETDEAERCRLFLLQLDPAGPWSGGTDADAASVPGH